MYIRKAQAIAPCLEDGKFEPVDSTPTLQLFAKEPKYSDIPRNILRRMGKATRMGVGTALSMIEPNEQIDGIVMGTGLGGMEDCIKFLNQIVDYEEGTLTPTNFVQSTPNALAGSLGLMLKNTSYNMTHVGRGGAFEAAVLDCYLTLKENSNQQFLLGSTEEISTYNFNIDKLDGLFKEEPLPPHAIYNESNASTPGSICGEGSTMFLVSDNKENAICQIQDCYHLTSKNESDVYEWFDHVLKDVDAQSVSHLILGNNGDVRFDYFYDGFAQNFDANIVNYKHLTGDYPSATAFATYLTTVLFQNNDLPDMFYADKSIDKVKNVIIYNNYLGEEHTILHFKNC